MDTRFELVKPLGEGGQGRVFLVRDQHRQGALVALKRIGDLDTARDTLALEFNRLAGLRHSNLARAYDFGEDDEGVFFTSEYVDGPDIVSWSKHVLEHDIIEAMGGVLRALSLLHDRNLVHGDLSPTNLLIAKGSSSLSGDQPGNPVPKLLDLGGACRPGQIPIATTPGFTAPEILTGRGVLSSSDLYSFGILLALILFHKNPFASDDASGILERQLGDDFTLPDPELSPLSGFCMELISRDPARRPKTAQAALEKLFEITSVDLAVDMKTLLGGYLPEPKFVGRRSEMATLTALIDHLGDSQKDQVGRIEGPENSGKSTALENLIRAAQLNGLRVIGKAGGPANAPYLLDELKRITGMDSVAEPWTEDVAFAFVEALSGACEKEPVFVAIDDLSSCDKLVQTIAVTLARALTPERSNRPRIVLVTAGAAADFDPPWQELSAVRVPFAPLSQNATYELVSSMLPGVSFPDALPETVYLASGGWPGNAESLVRQAVGPYGSRHLDARAQTIVSALEKESKELLAALSMAGEPIPANLLETVGSNATRLNHLLDMGILSETPGPTGPLITVSQSTGTAAVDTVPVKKQQRLATELAAALAEDGRLATAAHLWSRAGDEATAAQTFVALARQHRERGDLPGAGAWFKEAINRLPDGKETTSLIIEAMGVWRSIGMPDLALEQLGRTNLEAREAVCLETALMMDTGQHREALKTATHGLTQFPNDLSLLKITATAELQLGQSEKALATTHLALDHVDSSAPDENLAQLTLVGGLACIYLGQLDQATTFFDTAANHFTQLDDRTGQLRVLANKGMLSMRKGDLKKAFELYDQAVTLSRDLEDRPRERLHLMNRATVTLLLGDIALALRDYLAALDMAVVLGNRFAQAQTEVNLADLLSGVGEQAEAVKTATKAIERCRIIGQERLEVRASMITGVAMLRADAIRQAESRLMEARRRFAALADNVGMVTTDIHLAELKLRQGKPATALRIAKKTAALAEKLDRRGDHGRALVLVARAMAKQENTLEDAIALMREAERHIEEESLPDELWRLRYHLACILKQAGNEDEAAEVMIAARTSLDAILEKVPAQYRDSFIAWGEGAGLMLETPTPPSPDQPHREMRDLTRLIEINRELTREHDPKRLLPLIMKVAVDLTDAERGMIVMPREKKLEPVFSHQISDALDVRFSRSVAEKVIDEGRSILAIDAMGDKRFSQFVSVHTMKLRSILAVPLQIRNRIVGVIYLDSRLRAGVFSDSDLGLLEAFSAQAAISLETSRLISENAKRCTDLQRANEEIQKLSNQLEKKLERNEATLRRVGALLQKTQKDEATRLKECGIVGRSPAMQEIMRIVDRIALTDAPVYLFGASGTGKELVAKAIHATSERSAHPFVPVNCGALPSKLLASELFGHAKGAFTGAIGDRPGLFRLADKGTLLLDEVADMDASMQAHLLRVLQDGTFRPVGGNEEISVDVRILSASNRDLEKEVQDGRFREDLFYRLNVVRIDIPPLTGRKEDIPLLVDYFADHHAINDKPTFSESAMDSLINSDWPGNVRELENEVLRALTMATTGKPIGKKDLSPRLRGAIPSHVRTEGGSLKQRTDSFERAIIQKVLEECDGNASRAAEKLGISRAGLYKKLDKHGIRK